MALLERERSLSGIIRPRLLPLLIALVISALVLVLSMFLDSRGAEAAADQYPVPPPSPPQIPNSNFSLEEARAFRDFPVFSVGTDFREYQLVAVHRHKVTRVNPHTPIRPNFVSFIYGECDARRYGSCAPPLEVRSSPSCLYTPADISDPPDSIITVRGVPAALYSDEQTLRIVTGATTISIYGGSSEAIIAAAQELESENFRILPGFQLPPPPDEDYLGTCRLIEPPPPPPGFRLKTARIGS